MSKQRGRHERHAPDNQPDDQPPAGLVADGAVSLDLPAVLAEMFQVVRAYLLDGGRATGAHAAVATNAKGQLTRAFDAEAERLALAVAARRLGAYRAFSEELGEVRQGGDPRWTLVLDPCDGSNNFRRGVRGVGFAVAALPGAGPLDPDQVTYALCGDVYSGSVYAAARGRGATLDGQPCHTSALRTLAQAMLSVNLGRTAPPSGHAASAVAPGAGSQATPQVPTAEASWHLIPRVAAVRRIGATVLDLCYVAQGAFDAYVDLRGRLTPENLLAPALIIREAGGIVTDGAGRALGPVEFTTPYTLIAAANADLHAEILCTLGVLAE